jgi:predicted PurR-regulated permease PerM
MQTLHKILEEAEANGVAIGHFNISDLVILKGVFEAVRDRKVPVIVGASEGERAFVGDRQLFALVESLSVIQLVSTRDNVENLRFFAGELNVMFQHYIRAKVILAGLSLVFCSVTTLLLGFPHALALGVLAGVLEFIPVAGWMISATTIITFGALTHSHWIWMAALLGLWRMLMDYFISPRVVGHELEIHPLLAIFTVMVGGAVGGIVGIYLSVPVVATLRVVYRRFLIAQ